MTISAKTLIETATLTEGEVNSAYMHGDLTGIDERRLVAIAARDKALYAVVEWLKSKEAKLAVPDELYWQGYESAKIAIRKALENEIP
mgnify:CR=1 FL=1